jgi:hypothetical protein
MFTTVGVTSLASDEKLGRGTFIWAGAEPSFQKGLAWLTESIFSEEAMNIPTTAEHTATMSRAP